MQITVCCCTYNRPRQLGHLIRCFEQQSYANRRMVILDDAGQYPNAATAGDRWNLVSIAPRCKSLGEKRNACARMALDLYPETAAFAIWDDDDLYLPWALEASVAALQDAEWSRPSLVLHPVPDDAGRWTFRQHRTGGLYHGGWVYRTEAFQRAGGYPSMSGPEDQALMRAMERLRTREADPMMFDYDPFYIYPWGQAGGSYHISGMLDGKDHGERAWDKLGMFAIEPATLTPADPPWFDLLNPDILPGIHPRPF